MGLFEYVFAERKKLIVLEEAFVWVKLCSLAIAS